MGIGTSLGAYFEDRMKFQSGFEEVIEPPKTGDNNVVTPKGMDDNKKMDAEEMKNFGLPVNYVSDDGTVYPEPYGLNPPERETPFPRPKLSEFVKGLVDSGKKVLSEFDRGYNKGMNEEDMTALSNEMALFMLGNPGMRIGKNVAKEAVKEEIPTFATLGEETPAGNQVRELIASARRNVTANPGISRENLVEMRISNRENEFRRRTRDIHPDDMNDADFYTYGEYQRSGSMTAEQEARWEALDNRYAAMDEYRQIPFEEAFDDPPHFVDSIGARNRAFDDPPHFVDSSFDARIKEAMGKKDLNFFQTGQEAAYGQYYFASDKGVGEIALGYSPASKTINVMGMGIIRDPAGNPIDSIGYDAMQHGPQSFGFKETKAMLNYLKERYPEAEWITGYRISGGRGKNLGHGETAKMWIGKGPNPARVKQPARKTIQELDAEWEAGSARSIED